MRIVSTLLSRLLFLICVFNVNIYSIYEVEFCFPCSKFAGGSRADLLASSFLQLYSTPPQIGALLKRSCPAAGNGCSQAQPLWYDTGYLKETRQYRHCPTHPPTSQPLKVSGISQGILMDLSPSCLEKRHLGLLCALFCIKWTGMWEMYLERGDAEALMTPFSISFGHQDGVSGKQIKIWYDF